MGAPWDFAACRDCGHGSDALPSSCNRGTVVPYFVLNAFVLLAIAASVSLGFELFGFAGAVALR